MNDFLHLFHICYQDHIRFVLLDIEQSHSLAGVYKYSLLRLAPQFYIFCQYFQYYFFFTFCVVSMSRQCSHRTQFSHKRHKRDSCHCSPLLSMALYSLQSSVLYHQTVQSQDTQFSHRRRRQGRDRCHFFSVQTLMCSICQFIQSSRAHHCCAESLTFCVPLYE